MRRIGAVWSSIVLVLVSALVVHAGTEPAAAATGAPFPMYTASVYPYGVTPLAISDDGTAVAGLRLSDHPDHGGFELYIEDDGVTTAVGRGSPFGPQTGMLFPSDGSVLGVSDHGQVATTVAYGDARIPVVVEDGVVTCLVAGCSTDLYTTMTAINDAHQSVGLASPFSRVFDLAAPGSSAPLGGDDFYARSINDGGLVGGARYRLDETGNNVYRTPALVGPGEYDVCALLSGRCDRVERGLEHNEVIDVNDRGSALVTLRTKGGACTSVCTFAVVDGRARNISPGATFSQGVAINDSDLVVGYDDQGVFLWQNGTRMPVQPLVRTPGVLIGRPIGLTEAGEILAEAVVDRVQVTARFTPDLVVNTTADLADADPSDGVCTVVGNPRRCSLRSAIITANASPTPRTISFRIGAGGSIPVIRPQGALPAVTAPGTVIDGSTQHGVTPALRHVAIDGRTSGSGVSGLRLLGAGATVTGLLVYGFADHGIVVGGDGGHTVTANVVGLDAARRPRPNLRAGIHVSSPGNVIGTADEDADGNLVAGNGARGVAALTSAPGTGNGIEIVGAVATGNQVLRNIVGVDPATNATAANRENGILVHGAADTVIRQNVVAGSGRGIAVVGVSADDAGLVDAPRTTIAANVVGVSGDPLVARPNRQGIVVLGATGTTIGGEGVDANLVSGNSEVGIAVLSDDAEHGGGTLVAGNLVGLDDSGTATIGNGVGIGVTAPDTHVERNQVAGNEYGVGALTPTARGLVVTDNLIGTTAEGSPGFGNTESGLEVRGVPGVVAERNTISGGAGDGLRAGPDEDGSAVTDLTVSDNLIGLDPAGVEAVGNGGAGIVLDGVEGVTLRGNVVSANTGSGIVVGGGSAEVSLLANTVGLDGFGLDPMPNGGHGIAVLDATDTEVGDAGAGNVSAGNGGRGVLVGGDADGVAVRGNRIGVDGDEAEFLPNDAGGILVEAGALDVVIGGGDDTLGNVVAVGIGAPGVEIHADDTAVLHNGLGTNGDLDVLGAGGTAVQIDASRVVVAGNLIRNVTNGVVVQSGRLNRFAFNSTHQAANGYLLLAGANDDIEAPVLLDALLDGGTLFVTGSFQGAPNTTYQVQLFASEVTCTETVADDVAFGQHPFASASPIITTDAAGHAVIDLELDDPEALAGRSLTVVVSDLGADDTPGNTSQFSNCQAL